MTASRQRSSRRMRSERNAVIVRQSDAGALSDVQHGVRLNAINWRYVSGLIIVTLILLMVVMLRSDVFIVRGISVSGTTYLDTREIFRYTGIAEQHILQVNPERVRAALAQERILLRAVIDNLPDLIYAKDREGRYLLRNAP